MFRQIFVGLVISLVVSARANATVLQIEWTGLIYATNDVVGNVFDNGAGDNTGVGAVIGGSITWTDPRWNFGERNGVGFYDQDLNGNHSYHAAERDPFVSIFDLGGETYSSEMNFGSYHSIAMTDTESGSNRDSYSMWIRNAGYYQVGPAINGVSDHVELESYVRIFLEDPIGGQLINGTSVTQEIDWVANVSGSAFGRGTVNVHSYYWENGTDFRYSGTRTATIEDATASFVLTSFRATTVPEPSISLLLAGGLLGMAFVRRRHSRLSKCK
jgi:hypothetical protein